MHTLSHVLIREMAMSCGYGAASLTERMYAWPTTSHRQGAAGLLICTTASDSEGTLGGLVALSEPMTLQGIVQSALRRASRFPVGLHGCLGRAQGLAGITEDGGPLLRSGESPHRPMNPLPAHRPRDSLELGRPPSW